MENVYIKGTNVHLNPLKPSGVVKSLQLVPQLDNS